ncbi:MAG: translation elongation factor 4 [Calditrichia bacterium]|nr:translation elongation factor 4 [Calditrichia bacterium]
MIDQNYIRNFCIIAHIDHGKSTLADRLLEYTGTIQNRKHVAQVLDDMDLERERGITIKAHAIRMEYQVNKQETYELNLVDTPGHVDFSYEVSRSLASVEGSLLIVDAAQGVEAQTISTLYQAIEQDLVIIPVINKIDLPGAQIEDCKHQIMELIGCDEDEIILASAKTGEGIEEIIDAIIKRIPSPTGSPDAPLQALIFDSMYDSYRGALAYIRVFEGTIKQGDAIKFFFNGKTFEAEELGYLVMGRKKVDALYPGEVGYLVSGAKEVKDTRVGDTVTHLKDGAEEPWPGYREVKPMVYAGIYPVENQEFENLRASLDKLALNDASIKYEPESSSALGFGFRCGFLGLLHMEIVQERLEREFDQEIIITVPNVVYRVHTIKGKMIEIESPSKMPEITKIDHFEEPFVDVQILTPPDYIGNVMKLASERRGQLKNTEYLDPSRADIHYLFPLSEIIFDFFDKLKSISRGYASLDYEFHGYIKSKLVKLDIMINGEPVDALSTIIHQENAHEYGKKLCSRLRKLIPRQLYEVILQAAIGSNIISRETVKALRKNVTAKCYGGDISRKRKLLEKQKAGKKRMKQVGRIEIPQDAFLAVLSVDDS